jgi:hypothetical protein
MRSENRGVLGWEISAAMAEIDAILARRRCSPVLPGWLEDAG